MFNKTKEVEEHPEKRGVFIASAYVTIYLASRAAYEEALGELFYRVSLEGLDRSVLTQLTHMDAHVCAAGGKRVIALPVYIQSRCCWEADMYTDKKWNDLNLHFLLLTADFISLYLILWVT